jgi:hypothetical protein
VGFWDDEEAKSGDFKTLEYGVHEVKVQLREKDGEPLITATDKGPRANFRVVAADGASAIFGQTFNLKGAGVIAGMNKAMGFSAAQMAELTDDAAGWTETGCPMDHVIKIATMWGSCEKATVEASEGQNEGFPEIKFKRPSAE